MVTRFGRFVRSTCGRLALAVTVGLMVALIGGAAGAAVMASGPPVTAPTPTVGPFYSGPVHVCASTANEGSLYVEEHSTARGNCAHGYVQMAANELTPGFKLQIGSTVYSCTTSTTGAGAELETMITCPAPAPAPAG